MNTILVVTTQTGTRQAPMSDLNHILMVMADCKTDMVAHMTKMVMNWHTVSRNGMDIMMVLEEDLINL